MLIIDEDTLTTVVSLGMRWNETNCSIAWNEENERKGAIQDKFNIMLTFYRG